MGVCSNRSFRVVLVACSLFFGLVVNAKRTQKTEHEQKYITMNALNAALENVPFLTVRFALTLSRVREVHMHKRYEPLEKVVRYIIEPVDFFLSVAREQKVAIMPLFEEILRDKKMDHSKKPIQSMLIMFCKGSEQHAQEFFAKTIVTPEHVKQLTEEMEFVFESILQNMTEVAKKKYEEDLAVVRTISLKNHGTLPVVV